MNDGARQANDESRQYSERLHREQVIELLVEIRDLLKVLASVVSPKEGQ